MKYHVVIGDRSVEVDLSGSTPRVNGHPVEAELVTVPDTPVRHLRLNGDSQTFAARPGNRRGLWHLTVRGRSVVAEVVDERTKAIRAMAGGAEIEAPRVLVAPMPGMVVRVNVEPGQAVTAGQGVIVVEAMKMENELKSPADGVVARVAVTAGQAVEKGALLIAFE